jgi:hypothetical protein
MANSKSPHPHSTLHYNKTELLKDYQHTYAWFMKVGALGVLGAIAYFFALAVYLGGRAHTHSDTFVQDFGSRITYDYAGTKLPMFEDPSKAKAFIKDRPKNSSEPATPTPAAAPTTPLAASIPSSTEVVTPLPAAAPASTTISPTA